MARRSGPVLAGACSCAEPRRLRSSCRIGDFRLYRLLRARHKGLTPIALRLAGEAGVATPQHKLIEASRKAVMQSRRFDRAAGTRIRFLSAMATMGAKDGERGSYPEIVDALAQYGAQGKTDAHAL